MVLFYFFLIGLLGFGVLGLLNSLSAVDATRAEVFSFLGIKHVLPIASHNRKGSIKQPKEEAT